MYDAHANIQVPESCGHPSRGSELQESNKSHAQNAIFSQHSCSAWTRQVVQAPGVICRASTGAIKEAVWWSSPERTVTLWVYFEFFAGELQRNTFGFLGQRPRVLSLWAPAPSTY